MTKYQGRTDEDKLVAILTAIITPDSERLAVYSRIIEKLTPELSPVARKSERWMRRSDKRGLLLSVVGPRQHVSIRGCNVLAGITVAADPPVDWRDVGGGVPDGSFVAVRSDDSVVEVVTDYTGSTSIWYATLGCGGTVASNSFELIIALLGDFRPDPKTLGWFLSSGTTGPRRSWDVRVKPMSPNSILRAKKSASGIIVSERNVSQSRYRTTKVDVETLRSAVTETFAAMSFGDKPWLLALSGGYDSRAMLYGTRHLEDVTCVTWVDQMMTDIPGSDLEVARTLAAKAGREHRVLEVRRPDDAAALDAAVRRFVRFCDGRVDNIFAYLDGMQIWDELGRSRVGGLLRGDELFGSAYAVRESQILHNMRLDSFLDYAKTDLQRALYQRYDHETPVGLLRRPREKVSHWRWRIRSSYEFPTVYAALNAVRARYVQCCCPLLTRRIVDIAGALPSADHDDRALYKKMVDEMYPDVPIATSPSIINRSGFQRMPPVTEILLDHLSGRFARNVLGERCATEAAQAVARLRKAAEEAGDTSYRPPKQRKYVPSWAKRTKKRLATKPALDLPTLAMRSYLANAIDEEMSRTAATGNRSRRCVARAIA